MHTSSSFFLSARSLVEVSGFDTSYQDSAGKPRDISELRSMCFMAPEALQALERLRDAVQHASGTFHVTELYRSWPLQAQAHDDWLAGRRVSYAAPPGQSFHFAGRAVDLDTSALNFAGQKKDQWLQTFWSLAIPLGWMPIISSPDMRQSESWHFEYPGEWSSLYHAMKNAHIASCAALDAGEWDTQEPLQRRMTRYVQAQVNRLTGKYCEVDGIAGRETLAALQALGVSGASMDEAARILGDRNRKTT